LVNSLLNGLPLLGELSEPHLIVLTCKPHTVRNRAVSNCHGCDVTRPEAKSPDQK